MLRFTSWSGLLLLCFFSRLLVAAPPSSDFQKVDGDFHCEAPWHGSGCHRPGYGTLVMKSGYEIDRSYQQEPIYCCGGEELPGSNQHKIHIPAGVYVEITGGQYGDYAAVYDFNLMAKADDIDSSGRIKAWTVTTRDMYCGPSASEARHGAGCNVNANVWIKVKPVKATKTKHLKRT